MAETTTSLATLRRALARLFERTSARPLSVAVFLASALLLVFLQSTQLGRFRARAVAEAQGVEHPALVASYVARVFVRSGDLVEPGAPLAELSPHFIERELAEVNAEIEQLLREAELARARLLVDEERWLDSELRRRPNSPSLGSQTDALFGAQLELLQTRRAQLQDDLHHLTIASESSGRVTTIAPQGSSVAIGSSIASVMPEYAQEIVAYVPPETDPMLVVPGTPVQLAETQSRACREMGSVLRRGAGVAEAPGQLRGLFRTPVHGMPVYISIPDGCQLGPGQVLSVEFPKAGS